MKIKYIAARIDERLAKKIKTHLAKNGLTLQGFLNKLINDYFKKEG